MCIGTSSTRSACRGDWLWLSVFALSASVELAGLLGIYFVVQWLTECCSDTVTHGKSTPCHLLAISFESCLERCCARYTTLSVVHRKLAKLLPRTLLGYRSPIAAERHVCAISTLWSGVDLCLSTHVPNELLHRSLACCGTLHPFFSTMPIVSIERVVYANCV